MWSSFYHKITHTGQSHLNSYNDSGGSDSYVKSFFKTPRKLKSRRNRLRMFSPLHKRLSKTYHLSLLSDYKVGEWKGGDNWHYIFPYEAFRETYPRISKESPCNPWVAVQGNVSGSRTQKKSRSLSWNGKIKNILTDRFI